MRTDKIFLLIAAALLSGAFCAASAMADVNRPEAYKRLTAVEMDPGHAPQLSAGVSGLSGNERRYAERLPLQLEGAIRKVKASKYRPAGKAGSGKYKRSRPAKVRKSRVKNLTF